MSLRAIQLIVAVTGMAYATIFNAYSSMKDKIDIENRDFAVAVQIIQTSEGSISACPRMY